MGENKERRKPVADGGGGLELAPVLCRKDLVDGHAEDKSPHVEEHVVGGAHEQGSALWTRSLVQAVEARVEGDLADV